MTNKNKPTDNITEGAMWRVIERAKSFAVNCTIDEYKENEADCLALRAALQNAQPASVDVGSIKREALKAAENPDFWENVGTVGLIKKTIDHLAVQGYLHPKPGFVMVPREPTQKMLDEANDYVQTENDNGRMAMVDGVWEAMIAAAEEDR